MSEIIIERVCENDLADCLDMIRQSFSTVANDFELTEENARTNPAFMKIEWLIHDFESGKMMFKLVNDFHIIGFVQLQYNHNGTFELERLAVVPEFRHLGYGKRLIQHAVKISQNLGAKKLHAGIIDENTVLKEWYLRNGFTFAETKKFEHLPFTVGYIEYDLTN